MSKRASVSVPGAPPNGEAGKVAAPVEGEVEVVEKVRSSLLDVVISEYNEEKHLRTSRLLLTGQMLAVLAGDSAAKVTEFHKNFFEQYSEDAEVKVTGAVFLVNSKAVILLLEAPTTVLFDMLRLLREGSHTSMYKDARVLSLTEEVPRCFPVWATRVLTDMPPAEFVAPTTTKWLKEIFTTLKELLEMGLEMAPMTEAKASTHLHTCVAKTFLGRIPSLDKVRGYAKCPDLCSVSDYLDIYDKPVECTLEGELVWPLEPFLKY